MRRRQKIPLKSRLHKQQLDFGRYVWGQLFDQRALHRLDVDFEDVDFAMFCYDVCEDFI
jgi:hypothetical protein